MITRLQYDGGAIVAAHVFATSAKVDLRSGESAFLDREPEGWRITPRGASPRRASPTTGRSTARPRPDAHAVRPPIVLVSARLRVRVRARGAGAAEALGPRATRSRCSSCGIFLAALVGQALVGHGDFNHQQLAHHDPTMSLGRYVALLGLRVDVMENWQSEYLQFTLFILATVWLVQRGSPESKQPGKAGGESDEEQKVGEHARRGLAALGARRRLAHARSTRTRCCS